MAIEIFTSIPDSFEAGTTLLFTESFSDFPTSTWSAYLILLLQGSTPVRSDAAVVNSQFSFNLVAATTAGLQAGVYDYAIYVTSGTQRAKAKSGKIAVLDDLAVSQPQTFAEKMVETLERALATLAATTDSSVSFNGQSFTQASVGEYQRQMTFWQSRVIAERQKLARLRGTADNGFVAINFGPSNGVGVPWIQ